MAARIPLLGSPTLAWIARAAEDPVARHPAHLPETLDFREYAPLFLNIFRAAPPGVEVGTPMVLTETGLEFPRKIASHHRYEPFLGGGRFVGTFHVHPTHPKHCAVPFFDPQDLAATLRSDNPGFVELLLTEGADAAVPSGRERSGRRHERGSSPARSGERRGSAGASPTPSAPRLYALVRSNPYLYISAHHVTRNPMLLAEPHAVMLRRSGAPEPGDPDYPEAYRRAGLYFFDRYQLALYEGGPEGVLRRTVTPEGVW